MKRAVLAFALVLLGCGTPRRGEPLVGVIELDVKEKRGEQVFMQKCNLCHPGGERGLGPSLNAKPAPGEAIRLQVRKGLGKMPSFNESSIPPPDLDALIAYMIEIRHNPPPSQKVVPP